MVAVLSSSSSSSTAASMSSFVQQQQQQQQQHNATKRRACSPSASSCSSSATIPRCSSLTSCEIRLSREKEESFLSSSRLLCSSSSHRQRERVRAERAKTK